MNNILRRLDGETENQTLWRIGKAKADGLLGDITWPELAEFLNKEFRADETQYYDPSAYRKRYKNFADAYDELFSKENFTNEEMMTIAEHKRELEKAKIKLRDERIDYQKSLREDARRESFIELIERAMAKNVEPFDYKPSRVSYKSDSDDMVVCLSDLHAGIEVQNWWNSYDIKILRKRLHKYLDEIFEIQDVHQCRICHLVLGGDNISGLIHTNLRLQNNENVVEQLKIAVTYIGEFIDALQSHFDEVRVHSVSGNHSRLNPNKDDHLKGEELDDMIPFCLSLQFAGNSKVEICEGYAEKIDSTISAFVTTGGKRFYVVHGDKDAPSTVVKNLTLMSGTKPDGIIMGHRHHNALDSEHNVKVVQCGCVVGTDDYCVDKRISGEPEQCVFITSKNRAVKCLYDIGLN
jgi:predicted phosphodiesterase